MKFIKKILAGLRKGKFFLKYLLTRDIINMETEEANLILKEIAPPLNSTPITKNIVNDEYDLMIIVPAYNAEKWIKECVESIISQKTEFSFYAVFVDDGSKDSTGNILDSYKNNKNVKVIHQENKGYSGARNAALKTINGKYIMFVDSDDYLLPGAIQNLMEIAIKKDADIVEGNGYRFNENGRISAIKKRTDRHTEETIWGAPWMKVMRSALWKGLEFPEGYLYEDTIISFLIFPLAKKIYFIDQEVYAYRIHDDSITQKHDTNLRRVDSYWIMLMMEKLQVQFSIPREYENYNKIMKHIVFTYRRTYLLPDEIKQSIFIATRSFIIDNYGDFMNCKDKYYFLAKALKMRDYGKYVVFCEGVTF